MKFPVSLVIAILINILLFLAIQKLVQPDHADIKLPEMVTMLDFVRMKGEEKQAEPKRDQLPDKPKPPKKPPPPPEPDQPKPEKPEPPEIKPPTPEIKLPNKIMDGPHLGEFKRKPKPKKKPVQKVAPVPEPVVEEPAPVEPAEPVEETPEPVETAVAQAPEVATDVVPIYKTKPKYPRRALRAGIEGVVTIKVKINPQGLVEEAEIVSADPPKLFDKNALSAIKKWKFTPKMVNGKAVSQYALQKVTFRVK